MIVMSEAGPLLGMIEALYMSHTLGTPEIIVDTPLNVAALLIGVILQFHIYEGHQNMGVDHEHPLSECIGAI